MVRFSDIVGHQDLVRRMITNVQQGRLAHAQLLLGAEGSGHLALALAMAAYIHCTAKTENDACGQCAACRKMARFEHPDMHFFFPVAANEQIKKDTSSKLFLTEWRQRLILSPYFSYMQWLSHIGIENKQAIINAEDCNDIIRTLGYKSYESSHKIILIYMPEKIHHDAAPKLLKVLEEPPENTLFLLVAGQREQILNTILSRTQIIMIPPADDAQVSLALTRRFSLDHDKASHLAFLAQGNLALAFQLAGSDDKYSADLEKFRSWMRHCYGREYTKMLDWVEEFSREGREKQKFFLQYALGMLRMCMLYNYQAESLIRLDRESLDFLHKFARFVNHHNLLTLTSLFQDALFHLERNAYAKILFTDMSLKLSVSLRA